MELIPINNPRKKEPIAAPTQLSLYEDVPLMEMTLQEFDQWGSARLQVLKDIDAASSKGLKGETLNRVILDSVTKHMPWKRDMDSEKRDRISFFLLRLAHCENDLSTQWFLKQEGILFRYNFQKEDLRVRSEFIKTHAKLSSNKITDDQYRELKPQLDAVLKSYRFTDQPPSEYFQVPFEEVPKMVASRRVLLREGWAYVPLTEMINVVSGKFRAFQQREMAAIRRKLPAIAASESDRLMPIVRHLNYMSYDSADKFDAPEGRASSVSLANLDNLAKQSMPLCMRTLHKHLRTNHHLKHGGRMQYGLFLKGIGLTLEESLELMRTEFTKQMTPEKFEKEHGYNIRHNYGQEGKHVSYSPYSCMKIITGPRGPDEPHGCPYRHFDPSALRVALRDAGLSDDQAQELVQLSKESHYQVACQKMFAYTHPGTSEFALAVNHPNSYFKASLEHYGGKSDSKAAPADASAGAATRAPTTADAAGAAPPPADAVMEDVPQDILDEAMMQQ